MTNSSSIKTTTSQNGLVYFSMRLWHDGLGKSEEISNVDRAVLRAQAKQLREKWDSEYRTKIVEYQSKGTISKHQNAINEVKGILRQSLQHDNTVELSALRDNSSYSVQCPEPPIFPRKGLLASVSESRAARHAEQVAQLKREYARELQKWENNKKHFEALKAKKNQGLEAFVRGYREGRNSSVEKYCGIVLKNSKYPKSFPKSFELQYNEDTRMLIVNYQLPTPICIPTLESETHVKSTGEFKQKHMSKASHAKLYNDTLYQIVLRTLHELYQSDRFAHIASIAINGFTETIDPATGAATTPCILSIHAKREEFQKLALERVEPKAAFKHLRGVGSSQLYNLVPIAPLVRYDTQDSRFVEPYSVTDNLREEDNLAAMDWEDFEHLIREAFEKEFSATGGEVKITQASRDRGVDAVAYDPDPIRGGKIVIQAKRYTNTVGVDAVRDLYGTVINEGASKGILVTTSDYGPDSYEFAKGKPITLLNGSNLLHLLEKYGHKATINIAEARRILAEKKK